jgi:hypothetical protein
MLVATLGKIPRFFWFFLPPSSSSSPVPSPLPMLALLASPAKKEIINICWKNDCGCGHFFSARSLHFILLLLLRGKNKKVSTISICKKA